jgi:hypothetical protein
MYAREFSSLSVILVQTFKVSTSTEIAKSHKIIDWNFLRDFQRIILFFGKEKHHFSSVNDDDNKIDVTVFFISSCFFYFQMFKI